MSKIIIKILNRYKKNSLGFIADSAIIALFAFATLSFPLIAPNVSNYIASQTKNTDTVSQIAQEGKSCTKGNDSTCNDPAFFCSDSDGKCHRWGCGGGGADSRCRELTGISSAICADDKCYTSKRPDGFRTCGEASDCTGGYCHNGTCASKGNRCGGESCEADFQCKTNSCNKQTDKCFGPADCNNTNPPPPAPVIGNCGDKNCSPVDQCVGSSNNNSLGTFCIPKNGGALNSYCGKPNGTPNSYVCGTGYCNSSLKCATDPSTIIDDDDDETPPVTVAGNCGDKNCSPVDQCVGSPNANDQGTFCIPKNAGALTSYCGKPNGTPNSYVCGTGYCNENLRCAPAPDPDVVDDDDTVTPQNPVTGDSPLNPPIESNQCLGADGKVDTAKYLEPRCGGQKFDGTKATPNNTAYCGKQYTDVYTCGGKEYANDADIDACSKSPWCPTANTGGINPGVTTQPQSCAQLGGTCMDNVLYGGSTCTPSTGGTGKRILQQGATDCANPNLFCYVCQRTAVTPVPNVTIPQSTTAPAQNGTGEACATSGTICGGNNSNACYAAKDDTSLHCCRFTERFCQALGRCVNAGTIEFENCGKPQSTPRPTNQSCYPDNPATNHCYNGHADCCNPSTRGVYAGKSFRCTSPIGTGTSYCVESTQNAQAVSSESECLKNSDCIKSGKSVCVLNSRQVGLCE